MPCRQHVSNAAGGAEQDERREGAPRYHEGAVKTGRPRHPPLRRDLERDHGKSLPWRRMNFCFLAAPGYRRQVSEPCGFPHFA